jgi:chromate reductase, NAD(P)H dehydrogenase (quinone)
MKYPEMSMKYRIGLIVGSLRRESFNRRLADALMRLAPKSLEFHEIAIGDLPLYNQDDDAAPHENVRRLKAEVKAAQGIVFVTPEYNRSIPGVLKNALDHASRPYGQSVWAGKPAGVLGVSVGLSGTAMAQQHLRNTLAYLDMPTVGQPEVFLQLRDDLFDAQGNIGSDITRKMLQQWLERYASWVGRHQPADTEPMRQASRPRA